MEEIPQGLTALSEQQREQAASRFALIRPALEDGVPQAELARVHQIPLKTLQRWIRRYRAFGLRGLVRTTRSDKGIRRDVPADLLLLIEGLALSKPRRSMATIHRLVCEVAQREGWPQPSYRRVCAIIHQISPALSTLAHEGGAAYRETFDLLYRREASRPNELWQADHYRLPLWLLGEDGEPGRPWLTVIEDDYSRAVAGYRLTWTMPTALHTALTLRQAICRKEDAVDCEFAVERERLCSGARVALQESDPWIAEERRALQESKCQQRAWRGLL